MKDAKNQGKKADKQHAETIANLQAAATNKKKAAAELTIQLEASKQALSKFIATVPREHQREAIATQNKVNKLLAELKDGADVNNTIAKLNQLRK